MLGKSPSIKLPMKMLTLSQESEQCHHMPIKTEDIPESSAQAQARADKQQDPFGGIGSVKGIKKIKEQEMQK